MNKNLYDRKAKIPDSLIKHLKKCFNSANASPSDEGYKRNRDLVDSKVVTYQQIKRIKNWFGNYDGDKKDSTFLLNGGDRMKDWCDEVLRIWRRKDISSKKTKSDAGMENQFLDDHEKNSFNLNDKHSKTTDNLKEDVDRINKLIKKII